MLVKDVMVRAVKALSPDITMPEVASLMCLHRFSVLPVADENDQLIGVIAEQDVLKFLFPDIRDVMDSMGSVDFEEMEKEYKRLQPLKVADLMHKNVITVTPEMPILKAVSIMARNNFRRIPVAKDGKLEGIISLGDIHRAIYLKSFTI